MTALCALTLPATSSVLAVPVLVTQVLGVPAARAQEPAAATVDKLAAKARKAIADYENVKGNKKLARKARKQLLWLGEVDHELVTEYLRNQLEELGPEPTAAPILEAISKAPRPELESDVWRVLHHKKAPWAVRHNATLALLAMGQNEIDRVCRMLRKGSDGAEEAVRTTALQAICRANCEPALRQIASIFDQGTSKDKIKLLRIIDPVKGVNEISNARIKLVRRGSLLGGAIAWRQLAVEAHPRAADYAIDLLERMPEGPTAEVAVEMIGGIVLVRDPELYPLLLRYGRSGDAGVKKALRAAAPKAAKDHDLMRFMARHGLENDDRNTRDAALLLLRQAPPEIVAPMVERVRRKLRRPKRATLDLVVGLHDVLRRDPEWKKDVLRLAASQDDDVRTVGLTLLAELDADDAIEIAQKSLNERDWQLRAAAIRYLTKFRDVSSIPLLIGRFDKEEDRLLAELGNALFVHTGTRRFSKNEWRDWWRQARSGFTLPHPNTVKAGLGGLAGQTSAYFGIPLVSRHVTFIIDTSGSMNGPIQAFGTNKKMRRLDAAKRELIKALNAMPSKQWVNLVTFSTGVTPLWDELRQAEDENRKSIIDRTNKLRAGGGTNIYGALEQAFLDPKVDTIYLLTDGEPSGGEITNSEEIADEVRRWNRLRQIVVHTIGFGVDTELLRRLASESGGVYTYVK